MIIPKFISVDSTLNCLKITSNIQPAKQIVVKNYLKSDHFAEDFKKILKKNFIPIKKIKLILINLGPGSYAGIRNVLSSIKVFALLHKITIGGFTNYNLMRVVNFNRKNKIKIIIYFNKKFYQSNKKNINLDLFHKLLTKEKIMSNFEGSTEFEKNNILPFEYDHENIENLIKKGLYIQKKITPYY